MTQWCDYGQTQTLRAFQLYQLVTIKKAYCPLSLVENRKNDVGYLLLTIQHRTYIHLSSLVWLNVT